MSGTIIAIGGGKMYNKETLEIDRHIVKKTGKAKPSALFIPTASDDDLDYFQSFKTIYGDLLGCDIDGLFLVRDDKLLTVGDIKKKILAADLIYVGGGNTLNLMKIWRRHGLGEILIKAFNQGKVLAGMSAGSICWFNGGFSDSIPDKFVVVKGIGLLNAWHSPHFNIEDVKNNFDLQSENLVKKGPWYLLEDNSAMVVNGGNLYIVKSNVTAKAYCVSDSGRGFSKTSLVVGKKYCI